jgi:hypothetical protein
MLLSGELDRDMIIAEVKRELTVAVAVVVAVAVAVAGARAHEQGGSGWPVLVPAPQRRHRKLSHDPACFGKLVPAISSCIL